MLQRFSLIVVLASGLLLAGCAQMPSLKSRTVPTAPAAYNAPQAPIYAPAPVAQPLGGVAPQRTVKVGLLLPLSGGSKEVGLALRDAAVMALFDKYATMQHAPVKVELITKDTMGTPDGARAAAAQAVKEGASLLLGPLFASSVEAIKPLAATGKVTILSFSNRKEFAGDGVYLMGFDPAEQAERVANYAYRQDINTVAALAPAGAYGREVLGAFERVSKLLGRRLEPVVRYSAAGANLKQDIRDLAKQGTTGARFNFAALLLPEGGDKLGPILDGLKAANISSQTIQFIGTGLWDDASIIRNHNLNGAWLASSPPEGYAAFQQRYMATYGQKPPRLASLSYDAVALATTLASGPGGIDRRMMENPAGYFGPANGIFRFKADGTIERGLAVLQVNGTSGFTVIDPAPTRFR
jgi:branched-chain amino acid transport system substrate-binding protein